MRRFPHLLASVVVAAACASRTAPMATPKPASPAAPAVAAAPAPLRYSNGTNRYRLESQTHVVQEVMGQSQAVDVSTAVLVTVAVADAAAGNLGVGITIDSLAINLPAGAPGADPAALATARGKTTKLVASPQGQIVSVTPPDSVAPAIQQVAQGFREFLPQLPAAAPEAGATWTDSTTTTTPSSIGTATLHMARLHKVVGWEDHGGTRALHLTTTTTYTISGSGEAQGQSIELSGGGVRNADAFISAAGVYLEGSTSDSSLVNANVITAGMVVPVHSTTHSTLTRLP